VHPVLFETTSCEEEEKEETNVTAMTLNGADDNAQGVERPKIHVDVLSLSTFVCTLNQTSRYMPIARSSLNRVQPRQPEAANFQSRCSRCKVILLLVSQFHPVDPRKRTCYPKGQSRRRRSQIRDVSADAAPGSASWRIPGFPANGTRASTREIVMPSRGPRRVRSWTYFSR